MLIVRDGWGYSEKTQGNAIRIAVKPFDDFLLNQTPQALLTCHGGMVGLPDGFQGSSEVGHLNMGAGRIVEQEVTRIFSAIANGSLFTKPILKRILENLKKTSASLHLLGLLQDEGVHAHQEHLFELIRHFKKETPDTPIWVHCIADGRDTPPRSFKNYYRRLREEISKFKDVRIGSIWGRYYGMDRSKRWDLIKIAYRAMAYGDGKRVNDFSKSVEESYASELTPDGVEMCDEYLKPLIAEDYKGFSPKDVIINFNYRQDRAIQMSQAFMVESCPVYDPMSAQVQYYGLTRYYDAFPNYFMTPMDDSAGMSNLLGEVVSAAGMRQLRIAETQKFRHVTSFFNGKRTEPFSGEDQVEIPSQFDPSTFASHPEMNASDVTEALLRRLNFGYEFIVINFANCDMVGHTGDFNAAVRGAEIVDLNVKLISEAALQKGYVVLVTADHGNSEEMTDELGEPKTSHTINPVKLHILSRPGNFHLKTNAGILSDIGPLILKILGMKIPGEMTSRSLADALN